MRDKAKRKRALGRVDTRGFQLVVGVRRLLDSRFRGNDGVEIGGYGATTGWNGAIIAPIGLMSTRARAR